MERLGMDSSKYANSPQRGELAPTQPSLFSPTERILARSGFDGLLAIHPSPSKYEEEGNGARYLAKRTCWQHASPTETKIGNDLA
jgi:hypothetical protein